MKKFINIKKFHKMEDEEEHLRMSKEQQLYEAEINKNIPDITQEEYDKMIDENVRYYGKTSDANMEFEVKDNKEHNKKIYESFKLDEGKGGAAKSLLNEEEKELEEEKEDINKLTRSKTQSSLDGRNHFARSVPKSSKEKKVGDQDELHEQIIHGIKVRVEQLQSKIRSKADMYYVLRHMCMILNYYFWFCFRRISFAKLWWMSTSVHARYFGR